MKGVEALILLHNKNAQQSILKVMLWLFSSLCILFALFLLITCRIERKAAIMEVLTLTAKEFK